MRRSQTLRARELVGPGEEEKARKAAEEAEAEASSYPDAHLLGIGLAGRMEQAAISGEATVRLALGPIYGGLDDADRGFIAGEVRRIALIVRGRSQCVGRLRRWQRAQVGGDRHRPIAGRRADPPAIPHTCRYPAVDLSLTIEQPSSGIRLGCQRNTT
jgi:hypothetical protein